jgi:hypothetical protein
VQGKCLCGRIGFECTGEYLTLYQCHCSPCRKQGGSSSNTALIVASEHFRWIRGTESITSWSKDTGFRSDFCSICGSPVPNPLRNLFRWWVPAGLLDDNGRLKVGIHLFVGSKASWDKIPPAGVPYETMPELVELMALLHANAQE